MPHQVQISSESSTTPAYFLALLNSIRSRAEPPIPAGYTLGNGAEAMIRVPILLLIFSVATLCLARGGGRSPWIWIPLVWVLGYVCSIVTGIVIIETSLRVLPLDFLEK